MPDVQYFLEGVGVRILTLFDQGVKRVSEATLSNQF